MAAIYQWFQIYEEEYTTTLYPLEVQDALLMSVDFSGGYMEIIDQDDITMHAEMVAATVRPLLLSAPEQEDDVTMHIELVNIAVRPLLLEAPEQEDDISMHIELVNITVETILITAYMPEQGVLMDIDLVPGSCYMTAV